MDKFWKSFRFVCCSTVKERKEERKELDLEGLYQIDFAFKKNPPLGVLEAFDSSLAQLSSLEVFLPWISENSSWADEMMDKIQYCKSGLRFLRMFFWALSMLEDTGADAEIRHTSVSIYKPLLLFAPLPDRKHDMENWVLDLQRRIQICKQKSEEFYELVLRYSFKGDSFKTKKTRDFLDAILHNLKDLYKFKTDDEIVLVKTQIDVLEKKLRLLHDLLFLTPKGCRGFEEMREFKVVVHVFACYSASLVFLYWMAPVIDEERATQMNLLLFDELQKIKPVFKAFYFRFLKEMKLKQLDLDSLLLGYIIQILLDLLLDNLVYISKNGFEILQQDLIYVIAFLANPPEEHEDWMTITAEIEVLVKEDLFLVLSGNFSEENTHLSDFLRKVELVKCKIPYVYAQIWDPFSFDFPKTNGLGFFDFLLQNLSFLKEKLKRDTNFIPFAKLLIIRIVEELMSLRPCLDDLFEQQKEQKEVKNSWLKVINLAYKTEYAIDLYSVIGHYNMPRLMEVLDEIKVTKSNLNKIETPRDGGFLGCLTIAENKLPEVPWASSFTEVTVGLEKEVDIIVDNLIRGSKSLDIVAIVGMAGLGKTTMANKVYKSSMVRHHFHMFAYCIVSQVHNARRILLDILGDIKGVDDKMYGMMEEDLEDMLRKCLKGRRYLIIMDDMWDVKAWDEIKRSLPNDQNGSRVIFTTRIQNVALQAKKDCILHQLRFLTEEESWELLQRKAIRAEGCPPNLLEVGKMIAKNCKGLPLTIVLVAGLLARTKTSLSWWNTISKAIRSYVSTEGCMDVLELSYQHLPEHLKPCFLYFGAFTKDAFISVNQLTLLWIAEGFVQNANMGNLKNVAKSYLSDLVDRSLVIVTKRSSYGGIKSCLVHDLVHEFCQGKGQEENFFRIMDGHDASVCDAYRVCTTSMNMKCLNDATKIPSSIRSLLYSRQWGVNHHDCHQVSNLKLVKVMDMEGSKWDDTESFITCIEEIASLTHLRYLATSFSLEHPTRVPSSISNLRNLEFLILTGSRRFKLELPTTIWNMTRLRHVDVQEFYFYLSDSGIEKRESSYPQMVNLESLSSPNLSSTEVLQDLLQRSPSLRKLSFHYNYAKDEDFHFPKPESLCKLESLKISCVVSELRLRPFSFPSTLKKLSLSGGFLPWMYLQTISKMPCLEVLKLQRGAFIGVQWDMEDTAFPLLKFLKLEFLDLQEWITYGEHFPSLEVLIVNECYHLDTIPPCFGEILTLKRIEVFASCKVAASVVEIHEAQKDFGNEELEVIVSDWFIKK